MCDAGARRGGTTTIPRPRWGVLYGGLAVVIASVVAVEAFGPGGSVAAVLHGGVALVAAAAGMLWIRANRVALDLQDSCDCAREATTIRVIAPRRSDEPAVRVVTALAPAHARADVDEEATAPGMSGLRR